MADRKRESIVPSGIDTSASGYSAKDGKCSVLHNLRFADGAWRNIRHILRKLPFVGTAEAEATYHLWLSADDTSVTYGTTAASLAVGSTLYLIREEGSKVDSLGQITSMSEVSGLVTVVVGGVEYTVSRDSSATITLHGWSGAGGVTTYYTKETVPTVGSTIGTASDGYFETGVIESVSDIPATSYVSELGGDEEDQIYLEHYSPSAGDMGYRYSSGARVEYGRITAVRKYPKLTFNTHILYLDGDAPATGKDLYTLSGTTLSRYGTIEEAYTQPALYGYTEGTKVIHFAEVIDEDSENVDVYSYSDADDSSTFYGFTPSSGTDAIDIYFDVATPAAGKAIYMYTGKAMVVIDYASSVEDDGGVYVIAGYSRVSSGRYESTTSKTAVHADAMSLVGHTEHISFVEGDGADEPDKVIATIEMSDDVSNDLYDAVRAFMVECRSNESLYLLSNGGTSTDRTVNVGTEVYDSRTNYIGAVESFSEESGGLYSIVVRRWNTGERLYLDDVVVSDANQYHGYISVNVQRDSEYDLTAVGIMQVLVDSTSASTKAAYTNFSTEMAYTASITVGGVTKTFGIPTSTSATACKCIFLEGNDTALNVTASSATYTLYGYNDVGGGNVKYLSRSSASSIAVGDYVTEDRNGVLRTLGQVTERKSRTFRNVTVSGGTIRDVYDASETRTVKASEGYTMLYHHPAASDDRFIVDKKYTQSGSEVHSLAEISIDSTTGAITETQHSIATLDSTHTYTVHHFGKILILNDHTAKELGYFMLVDGTYVRYDSSLYSLSTQVEYRTDEGHMKGVEAVKNDLSGYKDVVAMVDYIYAEGEECWADHMNDYWRGEIAFFAALRSPDGEILKTSDVQVINTHMIAVSENGGFGYEGTYGAVSSYKEQAWITMAEGKSSGAVTEGDNILTRMYIPTLTITKSEGISDTDSFVGDVAIYCTRLNRSLDTGKIISIGSAVARKDFKEIGKDELYSYFRDNDLVDQPFYLMKTYSPSEFKDGEIEVDLKYELLENLAQAKTYSATQGSDRLYAEGMKEYNSILHLYDVTTEVDFGNPFRTSSTSTSYRNAVISYTVDSVRHSAVVGASYFAQNQGWYMVLGNNTASTVHFTGGVMGDGKYQSYGKVSLKSSDALGKAYILNRAKSGYMPYADIVLATTPTGEVVSAESTDGTYAQTNRIQCSADNNCFSYPYARSYRIGVQTSKVVAVNSVAMELSDSKFGEDSLYAFTTEGIFAMQSGTSVLYSAIRPVSYEVIVNPITLSANYSILFVTRRGLMSLSRKGIHPLSTELNSEMDVVPTFLTTCRMYYCPHYGEVMLTDTANTKAYVYSLANDVWYTRDMPAMTLLNEGLGVLQSGNATLKYNAGIYDLTDEMDTADTYGGSSAAVTMGLTTRPLKLGTVELKRLETLILRHHSTAANSVKVTIRGGADANTMYAVKEETISAKDDVLIRRTDASFRYITLGLEIVSYLDVVIACFDMEYYLRPSRRLK